MWTYLKRCASNCDVVCAVDMVTVIGVMVLSGDCLVSEHDGTASVFITTALNVRLTDAAAMVTHQVSQSACCSAVVGLWSCSHCLTIISNTAYSCTFTHMKTLIFFSTGRVNYFWWIVCAFVYIFVPGLHICFCSHLCEDRHLNILSHFLLNTQTPEMWPVHYKNTTPSTTHVQNTFCVNLEALFDVNRDSVT